MDRLSQIKLKMSEHGIDALWITSAENHRYLSGFHNPDGRMFITANKSYVFADFRYIEAAMREVYPGYEVIMPEGSYYSLLPSLASENGVRSVGYEDEVLPFRDYVKMADALPDCELKPASKLPAALRLIKGKDEVEKIVSAQRIAEAAFEHILCNIRYNMTEIEIAAEIEYFMKKNGAEGPSFDTIAVSGEQSSSPHGVPRNVKLEKGFLTLDFGVRVDGYCSDMTRTIVIGRADSEMRRIYNTVLDAQSAALDGIKEGISCFEADKIARDIIHGAGFEGCFGHGLGHGVGLQIHEGSSFSPFADKARVVRRGEVMTVEPGIYIKGKYGCRIEDMVYFSEDGVKNLTGAPKELIEI